MVMEELPFKYISYLELWKSFVQRRGTIWPILVEGVIRNKSVKVFLIWASGVQDMLKYFLSGILEALPFGGAEP